MKRYLPRNHTYRKVAGLLLPHAPMTATIQKWLGTTLAVVSLTMLTSCQLQRGQHSASDEATLAQPDPLAASTLEPEPVPAPLSPPEIDPELALLPEQNFWHELRQGFSLDHSLEQARVQQELRWLKRHPHYLARLQQRIQRYLPYIYVEVMRRDMPAELALLPIVESALDPYAFSHGGAAGLWQFIPATGKRFGLTRNWWYDGRRDPVLATQAALTYLQYLENRFDDWYLALAGYNAGEGNVKRALKRGKGERDFFRLRLPKETSAYVPRLLALAAVVANPDSYGLSLPEVTPEIQFATIDTEGQFDLIKAAEALEVELDDLYRWNPALNQWSTPPEGPHRLHVPLAMADDAQLRLSGVPEQERVNWLRIKIRNGDTLSQIARRHNTDMATLRKANNLRGSSIRAGKALLIPKSSQAMSNYPIAGHQKRGDYQVKPGDSLWSIANAHQVSVAALVRTNQIGPKEVLNVGQRLDIPGVAPGATPGASRDMIRKVRYGVRRGDSLARIASKFNVAINDIARWNELSVDRYLQPGQSLLLYVNVAAAE